jgi:hypothetical protein
MLCVACPALNTNKQAKLLPVHLPQYTSQYSPQIEPKRGNSNSVQQGVPLFDGLSKGGHIRERLADLSSKPP